MTELWCEAELKRPPLVTVDVKEAQFVEKVHQAITICLRRSQEDTEFAESAALLSRLIARRKNSFRRMIGFRILLKLNATTCRLLRADLSRDLELFCGALPDIVCGENSLTALPTKNCVDYVLLRLLSVHSIQKRIHDCSVDAADYFLELLRANNFFDTTTLLIAVIAKLRSLNVLLANRNIDLYHSLLSYRDRFPTNNVKNLIPDTTKLPQKLEQFQTPALDITEKDTALTAIVKLKPTPTAVITSTPKIKKRIDIGTELQRAKDTGKTRKTLKLEQLKTYQDVKRFLEEENKARKKSLNSCITHRVPNHLWAGAQKIFERKLEAGDPKKALSIFLKFLSTNL